jgi:predicted glutamine amidotransferase
MCRWVAYAGPEIFLEEILHKQEYSLVRQSLVARESALTTNGDGFGVAWYGAHEEPGQFRDILPAWNDDNLRSIAAHVRSRLFFAHVRASTGTSVSRTNCHPFVYGRWTFMHNGRIGNWNDCRRDIEALIEPRYYRHRQGTTDSEALFMVALSEGLESDPARAMQSSIDKISRIMDQHEAQEPLRISAAVSNGYEVWAFRYSSDDASPSLCFGAPPVGPQPARAGHVNTIASEPLDNDQDHWERVGERSGVHWRAGEVSRFDIAAPD